MNDHSELELPISIFEVLINKVPVDDFGEVLKIAGSQIAVVNVVGVLPNVNSQQGLVVGLEGVLSIGSVQNRKIVSGFHKPGPS